MTEAHRRLFEKAQEAYRRRDLEALKLIYDMLTGVQYYIEGVQYYIENDEEKAAL